MIYSSLSFTMDTHTYIYISNQQRYDDLLKFVIHNGYTHTYILATNSVMMIYSSLSFTMDTHTYIYISNQQRYDDLLKFVVHNGCTHIHIY